MMSTATDWANPSPIKCRFDTKIPARHSSGGSKSGAISSSNQKKKRGFLLGRAVLTFRSMRC